MALRSIGTALCVTLVACPTAQAAEEPPLVKTWLKEQKASCSPGVMTVKKGFLTRRDVNADGRDDYILDNGFLECDGQASYYCGTAGCDTTVIASVGDGYANVYEGMARNIVFRTVRGKPAMVLTTHGSGCGKIGAENCTSTLLWNGKTFAAKR
ncbi:MAG: hypothetical protein WAP03_16435 [Methylorubrum rhodinum]|jgi:hypothetical protein